MRNSARTLQHLRREGWHAEVCEKYITRPQGEGQKAKFAGGYRKDLFGFLDVVAFRFVPGDWCQQGVLGIQVTSRPQITAHLRAYRRDTKIAGLIRDWIQGGNRFAIHGWRKLEVPCKGDHTKTKTRWELTERVVTTDDLVPNAADLAAMSIVETNSRKGE